VSEQLTINQVDVAKLDVQRGEFLLVTTKFPLTPDVASLIRSAFKRAFEETGGNVPSILVIDDKIEARVVRAGDLPSGV
jgi:hypothetical protein